MSRPRFELRTFCVLDRCDNQLRHRPMHTGTCQHSSRFCCKGQLRNENPNDDVSTWVSNKVSCKRGQLRLATDSETQKRDTDSKLRSFIRPRILPSAATRSARPSRDVPACRVAGGMTTSLTLSERHRRRHARHAVV